MRVGTQFGGENKLLEVNNLIRENPRVMVLSHEETQLGTDREMCIYRGSQNPSKSNGERIPG